jgi:hypothetical protein
LVAAGALCAALAGTRNAAAYRPFDGTDAGVAAAGEFELELGPAHYYRRGADTHLIAPAGVLNLGFARRFEAVTEFREVIAVHPTDNTRRASLQGSDLLLKFVAREGALQGERGPSLALEGGVLTPDIGGDNGVGAQLASIASLRLLSLTLHLNEQLALSREHQVDLFSGIICEAPQSWAVRPVAELFVERAGHEPLTRSALLGAIWPAASSLAVDAGVRAAREGGRAAFELRLGFTWQTQVWRP